VDGRSQAFASGVRGALALLDRDFDTDSGAVAAARQLLEPLLDVEIAPARPDIGESLKRLRLTDRKG
ncbi:MAG TPA: hypothetical protein VFV10_06165, partial [Gammaproteobacteria bacterium]|nr:hypothetical protein [Gammaproteobacteria bacterium]